MKKIFYLFKQSIILVYFLLLFCFSRIFLRKMIKRNIWLINEKFNEARDNGYHFFKYLNSFENGGAVYFLIDKSSPDYYKVKEYKNLIKPNSFKHTIYWICAKYSVSSQAYGAFPFSINYKLLHFLKNHLLRKQIVVFLQHGVLEKQIDHNYFDYGKCNIDFFTTSTIDEHNFLMTQYKYPSENCKRVGLCRFDNLLCSDISENLILIMPTWRMWLNYEKAEKKSAILNFENSQYYKYYSYILSDADLINYLRNNNYKVVFYLHFQMQRFSGSFKKYENDVIEVAEKEFYDVQDLLKRSKLLITDYSSVAFDFAFQNKPLIYYQFDKSDYFGKHYRTGYFDYERDGLGHVCYRHNDLVELVKKYISNKMNQPLKYSNRVNKVFQNRDAKNCERTYLAICELVKHN